MPLQRTWGQFLAPTSACNYSSRELKHSQAFTGTTCTYTNPHIHIIKKKKYIFEPRVVVHVFNHTTQETEGDIALWIQSHSGLHIEFQTSLLIMRSCLKTKQKMRKGLNISLKKACKWKISKIFTAYVHQNTNYNHFEILPCLQKYL